MNYTVKNNQNILDVAVQNYGSLDYLFEMLKDNSLDLDSQISSGVELNLDLTECANLAWNEIKDRKGNTVNGTFIKD